MYYNEQFMEHKIYTWVMNKLDKDTVFQFQHTFNAETFTYTAFIASGGRTLKDNGVILVEFNWIEADI
jgi:hypothetical protein